MDLLTMLGALVVTLTAAAVIGGVKAARRRFPSRKPQPSTAKGFPVRLTCRDETEFHPGSGYHEGLYFEVFNHSDKAVRVKGFGLKLSMTGPGADWVEYEQARQHPPVDLPVWLEPHDGLEGYIDHEGLGEELRERGLFEYAGESTPYVEVVGFGEHTTQITAAALSD